MEVIKIINAMNTSEKQLKRFLYHLNKGGFKFNISLRPQGDNTIISDKAENFCVVTTGSKSGRSIYYFGGIKEKTFDKLQNKYYENK